MGFQEKVIAGVISDPEFLNKVIAHTNDEYFDGDSVKWILNTIKKFFSKYKTSPTLDVFKIELESEYISDSFKESVKLKLRNIVDIVNESPNLSYVKDKYSEFIRVQAVKNALYNSITYLDSGDIDKILSEVRDASNVAVDFNIGTDFTSRDTFERRRKEDVRKPIETPWPIINEYMQGGLSGGELGLFVAPLGGGKSWLLSSVGSHAIKIGYNVLHYTLELSESYISYRYEAHLSGYPVDMVTKMTDKVWPFIEKIPGKLLIKKYPTKRASLIDLESHLNTIWPTEYRPDMIIIDYLDLLKPTRRLSEVRFELQELYEETRGLADVFKIPIWSASQTNRESLKDDSIEADRISESLGKLMTGDFVLSYSRKTKDKIAKTARGFLIKNRFGPDGITVPSSADLAIGKVEFYAPETPKGKETTEKMETEQKLLMKSAKDRLSSKRKMSDLLG